MSLNPKGLPTRHGAIIVGSSNVPGGIETHHIMSMFLFHDAPGDPHWEDSHVAAGGKLVDFCFAPQAAKCFVLLTEYTDRDPDDYDPPGHVWLEIYELDDLPDPVKVVVLPEDFETAVAMDISKPEVDFPINETERIAAVGKNGSGECVVWVCSFDEYNRILGGQYNVYREAFLDTEPSDIVIGSDEQSVYISPTAGSSIRDEVKVLKFTDKSTLIEEDKINNPREIMDFGTTSMNVTDYCPDQSALITIHPPDPRYLTIRRFGYSFPGIPPGYFQVFVSTMGDQGSDILVPPSEISIVNWGSGFTEQVLALLTNGANNEMYLMKLGSMVNFQTKTMENLNCGTAVGILGEWLDGGNDSEVLICDWDTGNIIGYRWNHILSFNNVSVEETIGAVDPPPSLPGDFHPFKLSTGIYTHF